MRRSLSPPAERVRGGFHNVARVAGCSGLSGRSRVGDRIPGLGGEEEPYNAISRARSSLTRTSSPTGRRRPDHVSGFERIDLDRKYLSRQPHEHHALAAGLAGKGLPGSGVDEHVPGEHVLAIGSLDRSASPRLGVPRLSFEAAPGLVGFEHGLGRGDPLADDLTLLLEPRNDQFHELFELQALLLGSVFELGENVDGFVNQPANNDAVVLAGNTGGDD